MANLKHEHALPSENRRRKHVEFRVVGTNGAEHATAVTVTNKFPFLLKWVKEIHNGYAHDEAKSLITRKDLIAELAERIVHHLARHTNDHIEVIIGFSSMDNELQSARLQDLILQAIIACNTPVLREQDIQKLLTLKEYLFLIQQMLIRAPSLFHRKK